MQTHKLRNITTIIIVSIISLMLTMHLSLFIDESFTMSLIRHSYVAIIHLDAMDIHPPLYYLILKLFLYVFTFGHGSIITDVILARIFSFTCILLSFIVAGMTLRTMHLRFNASVLYTLLMILMLYIQEVSSIRMYTLATFFVVLEFYCLVKYVYNHQDNYLIALTFFAILAAYTHDYAAVIAGLLILLAFIHDIVNKSRNAVKWFISGLVFFIAYIPWIKVAINQALNLPSHYWILMINSLRDLLLFATLLLFAYPILKAFQHVNSKNQFIYKLILNTSIIMLLLGFLLDLHQPVFILRYICPLIFIYITLTFGFISNHALRTRKKDDNYIRTIILLFLFILGANAVYINYQYQEQFHYQTVQLQQTFNTSAHHIHINVKKVTQGNIRHLCQFNTYAQYQHKFLSKQENTQLVNNYKLKQGTSPKLMKALWKTKH